MKNEEKIKEIIDNQMYSISQDKMFSTEECMKEYGEWVRQQTLEETLAMVLKDIEDVQKAHTENGFGRISFLDTLKNKLLDNK